MNLFHSLMLLVKRTTSENSTYKTNTEWDISSYVFSYDYLHVVAVFTRVCAHALLKTSL